MDIHFAIAIVVSAWAVGFAAGTLFAFGMIELVTGRMVINPQRLSWSVGEARVRGAVFAIAGVFIASAVPILLIVYALWQPDTGPQGFQYDPGRIIYQTAAGQQLLAIAVILEIIGIIWFLYLLRVDY